MSWQVVVVALAGIAAGVVVIITTGNEALGSNFVTGGLMFAGGHMVGAHPAAAKRVRERKPPEPPPLPPSD